MPRGSTPVWRTERNSSRKLNTPDWGLEVMGSNPVAPTMSCTRGLMPDWYGAFLFCFNELQYLRPQRTVQTFRGGNGIDKPRPDGCSEQQRWWFCPANSTICGSSCIDFQDYLSPRLDTYEQAIYLYLFRHTLLTGKEEAVIGFKSARARMACGIGQEGRPMSENTAYVKLQSLAAKGCIEIVASEHAGRRIRVKLPKDIPGIIPVATTETPVSLDAMDFFDVPENRQFILQREENRCFYCLRSLTPETHVIEHVVSRPNGDSSYRNVVAACRECNNRKGSALARDFLRSLYRDGFLSDKELEGRLSHLERLECGDLKPVIPPR